MINERCAKKFCREDISMIENYEQALADSTQTWHCHHRDEIRILPSGMKVIRSKQDLIENGRYYKCPANELIFLTPNEHQRLHHTGIKRKPFTAEHRQKLSAAKQGENHPRYGKTVSEETRKKMSAAQKERTREPHSAETKQKIAQTLKGKTFTAEHRQKLREAWERRRSKESILVKT